VEEKIQHRRKKNLKRPTTQTTRNLAPDHPEKTIMQNVDLQAQKRPSWRKGSQKGNTPKWGKRTKKKANTRTIRKRGVNQEKWHFPAQMEKKKKKKGSNKPATKKGGRPYSG